jgi:hypothetical protein
MAAGAVVRIGSAVARATPGVYDKAMAYYKKATNNKVVDAISAQKFANRGVPQASIIAQGLAAAGMPVNQIISRDSASADPQLMALHDSLTSLYGAVGKAMDATRIGVAGHADRSDTNADVLRKDMALRLRRAFGSLENAERVANAMETFTSADYQWAKAMGF